MKLHPWELALREAAEKDKKAVVEKLRIERWHATFNAFVIALGPKYVEAHEIIRAARICTDEIHGALK